MRPIIDQHHQLKCLNAPRACKLGIKHSRSKIDAPIGAWRRHKDMLKPRNRLMNSSNAAASVEMGDNPASKPKELWQSVPATTTLDDSTTVEENSTARLGPEGEDF